MLETEKIVKNSGFEKVFLATEDKREFYEKLGYSASYPVTSIGDNPMKFTGEQVLLLRVPTQVSDFFTAEVSRSQTAKCNN